MVGLSLLFAASSLDGPNFGVAVTALVVSFLAFLIAAVSLAWQVFRHYRWGRPVLTVEGDFEWSVRISSTDETTTAGWFLSIQVVNTGDEPTEIVDAWWELRGGGLAPCVHYAGTPSEGTWPVTHSFSRSGRRQAPRIEGAFDPQVPIRLQPYSTVTWTFGITRTLLPVILECAEGRPAIAWISRRRRSRRSDDNPNLQHSFGEWTPVPVNKPSASELDAKFSRPFDRETMERMLFLPDDGNPTVE